MLLKRIPLYNRVKVIFSKKLLVVKKYINKYFNKGFIYVNILLITVLILLVKKLSGGIYIYVNYKEFNNVIIKNRYLIF